MPIKFKPVELYKIFMSVQENFCSCPKLQELGLCLLKSIFLDLSFREEWSMHLCGKVGKCLVIVIYGGKIFFEEFRNVESNVSVFNGGWEYLSSFFANKARLPKR